MTGRLITVANGITLFRVGLLGLLVWAVMNGLHMEAIWLFLVTWGLDAVDGFVARRMGEASEIGSLLDKVVDRGVMGVGLLLFLLYSFVPWYAIFLVTKDLGLLPLLAWRRGRVWEGDWAIGMLGKMMTIMQGLGLGWLLFGLPYPRVVVGVVALVGIYVAGRTLFSEASKESEYSG